jgi:GGDEF domain-containing protein
MVIALVVVAALAVVAVAALVAVRERARAERYNAALHRLDEELAPISQSIRQSVERVAGRNRDERHGLEPSVEELLGRIAEDGSAVAAFQQLAEEVVPDIASTRRRAVRSRRSEYEAELEREVARARRTGRPLSLVLVDVDHPTADRLLQVAALLTRVTRVTDTVCRRRRDAFGILLPETPEDGARRFYSRINEEAAKTFTSELAQDRNPLARDSGRAKIPGGGRTTFATGIVEWRPNETGDSLDARARLAVDRRAPLGGPRGADLDSTLDAPS